MGVLDRAVAWFPQMIGEMWGREAAGNGVNRLGVRHL